MRRRKFIKITGVAAAWPLAASAQLTERIRRVGVLLGTTASGPEPVPAFVQGLRDLGCTDGRNVRLEYRALSVSECPRRCSRAQTR